MTDSPLKGSRLGYSRVSTLEQRPSLQQDALKAARVERVFTDHASGVVTERPQLSAALEQLRIGDKLAVAATMLAEGRPKSRIVATIGLSRAMLYSHLGRLQAKGTDSTSRA